VVKATLSCLLLFALPATAWYQPAQPSAANALGRLAGTVVDPTGAPLSGVIVSLVDPAGTPMVTTTDRLGLYSFEGLRPGNCRLTAVSAGYEDYVDEGLFVDPKALTRVDLTMRIAPFSESVVISEKVTSASASTPEQVFDPETFDALPLPTDRFQEALPLIPGVVRDPEGRISFNGARPSQSMLLVNGANATDPVTGEFSVELPLKAIEEVEVNSLPYSAEYGRLVGAVAKVKTRGGTDDFIIDYGDFWPKPNFRDGTIKGMRSFVPQVQLSGPIKKGRAWFSQGVAYRYVRSRAFDISSGGDERILENFDNFTQFDFRLADDHHLTTTLSFFPVSVENLGLNALNTTQSTPDFESRGWNLAFSERYFRSRSVIETMLSVKRFDVSAEPKSAETFARLTPEGLRDNYFNDLTRDSLRVELASSVSYSPKELLGSHVLKFGVNAAYSSFSGVDKGLPIDLYAGGVKNQRIDFEGDGVVEGTDTQLSLFAQDDFQIADRLGLDFGLRYDYDRLVRKHQFGPRVAAAVALDSTGRTVVKAGWGVFFGHVFLNADGFESYQRRVETRFDGSGRPLGTPTTLTPRIAEEGLEVPRSTTWNAEINHVVREGLQLRLNYRERRGTNEMIVDRVVDGSTGSMLLSARGESFARELDVTMRFTRGDDEVFVSYARTQTTGDLNGFGALYQNVRSPLFLDNERSLYELDVPNRVLTWGVWHLPYDVVVSPGIEWRNGFPYTVLDGDYLPVGERNRGGRFPNFLSVDVRVMKGLTLKGRKVQVGFQLFNIGSHSNPRDVIGNVASPRFGDLLNSVDMGFSLRFSLGS